MKRQTRLTQIENKLLKELARVDLGSGKLPQVMKIVMATIRNLLKEPRSSRLPPSDWPADWAQIFRATYPRKTTMAEALRKLVPISHSVKWAAFKSGLERHAQACKGIEEKYIANPLTWVNQRRWEDPEKVSASAPQSKHPSLLTEAEWEMILRITRFEPRTMTVSNWNRQLWGPEPGEPDHYVPPPLLARLKGSRA